VSHTRSRLLRTPGAVGLRSLAAPWLVGLLAVALPGCGARHAMAQVHVAAASASPAPRPARRRVVLGRSVDGRPIAAVEVRAARPRATVLVVGCIHGNEPAGMAVARAVRRAGLIGGIDLWVIDDLNPDGVVANTRQNAHGIDLNRNFPWRWRHAGRRGDQQYPGPRPLSEPEVRLAHALILRLRPRLTIWFHQPLAITDESGGNAALARRFSPPHHPPLSRLPRYPGSATTWQNHRLPGATAFVVELPASRPSRPALGRYVRAVRTVAALA
jgi:murein peptide amidase A